MSRRRRRLSGSHRPATNQSHSSNISLRVGGQTCPHICDSQSCFSPQISPTHYLHYHTPMARSLSHCDTCRIKFPFTTSRPAVFFNSRGRLTSIVSSRRSELYPIWALCARSLYRVLCYISGQCWRRK